MPAARSSHKRGPSTLFARLYLPRLIVLGITAGILFSLFAGVLIIVNDMMSRVTFSDETFSEPFLARNLTDSESLDGLQDDVRNQLEDDFDSLQSMLATTESTEPTEPTETSAPATKTTKTTKKNKSTVAAQGLPNLVSMKGIDNIVLFGVDSRSNNFSGRADSIIILSLNHNNNTLNIVSLMRAMYVNIGTARHKWGMLNASYSYGGPSLAVRTIERNFGIPIKGYVAINFNAFKKIIDAAGGVRIKLTAAEGRVLGLSAGSHLLNGSQALKYARIRKIDTDFHRNQRQRNVINSMLSSMSSGGTNVAKVITVALANTKTNLNLRDYMSTKYLSYTRRQLQLPARGDTHRTYVNRREVWPFKIANTHKKLVNFLTGK